jgi:hypothetical protein
MKYSSLLILLAVLIFVASTLNICERASQTITNVVTYTKSDTIKITHIDTILFYDTNVVTKLQVDTIKYYYYDSYFFTFNSFIEDSLIVGNLITDIGRTKNDSLYLIKQIIDYKPKFPKYIHQTDSIIIHTKDCTVVTLTEADKLKFLVGPSLMYSDKLNISVNAGVTKKGHTFYYGFDPFNNYHHLGYLKTIKFK